MKEIKFRGKRLDNGEWVYGSYAPNTYDAGKALIITYSPYDPDYVWEDVDPTTVGQYTGLHDRKGIAIYEGDVIRSPLSEDKTRPHRIFYHTGSAAFMGGGLGR